MLQFPIRVDAILLDGGWNIACRMLCLNDKNRGVFVAIGAKAATKIALQLCVHFGCSWEENDFAACCHTANSRVQ